MTTPEIRRSVFDAEMAQLEPAHAAERAIDEGVGRYRGQRLTGQVADRPRQRLLAMLGQHAQHVALGDDAGLARTHGGRRMRRHSSDEIFSCAMRSSATPSGTSAATNFGGARMTSATR